MSATSSTVRCQDCGLIYDYNRREGDCPHEEFVEDDTRPEILSDGSIQDGA